MRPPRKMRQDGRDGGSSSGEKGPGNTARICLDGSNGRETARSYREGIWSVVTWCRENGISRDASGVFGPGVEIVTTPLRGIFHLELEYRERVLEVLINGRDLYLIGWKNPNGSFEIRDKSTQNESDQRNYMLGKDVRPVYMGKNYAELAPNRSLGDTMLGIYEFRKAFDELYNYNGGSPGTVKEAVGKMAVFISEATRFPFIEDLVCSSFTHASVSRLKQAKTELLWLQRWSHCSGILMEHTDCALARETPPSIICRGLKIQSATDIVPMIRVLHIDAYNKGKFAHDPLPKAMSEEPIEQMKGRLEKKKKGKQSHSKGEKGNKKQVKEQSVSTSLSRSSHHRYSTSSTCSSPSVDICAKENISSGCVEQTRNASKSFKLLGRGYGRSTLMSPPSVDNCVKENGSYCKSVCPSTSLDWWRHCVVENSCKSLKRGCIGKEYSRSALKSFGPQAFDTMYFSALQKICPSTAVRAPPHDTQPLITNLIATVWRKRTQLLKTGSEAYFRPMQKTPIQWAWLPKGAYFRSTQKTPIKWAGAGLSKVLRFIRR